MYRGPTRLLETERAGERDLRKGKEYWYLQHHEQGENGEEYCYLEQHEWRLTWKE